MPITKREEILIPFKSTITSAKFNAIFQSFLADIEKLESTVQSVVNFLTQKFVIGCKLTYDPGNRLLTVGEGTIVANKRYYMFADETTLTDVVLKNGDYIVFDTSTEEFTIVAPYDLMDTHIPLAVYKNENFDYSVRPIAQNITGEVYEPVVYALYSPDGLTTGPGKALAYIVNYSRMFTYDYDNDTWNPIVVASKTQTTTFDSDTTLSSDQDLIIENFVPSKKANKILAEINIYTPEATEITLNITDGTNTNSHTETIDGWATILLGLDVPDTISGALNVRVYISSGAELKAGTAFTVNLVL